MADMGHYSLWTVFNALELEKPFSIEPMLSHSCVIEDNIASRVKNDFSFPLASTVRFRFPARGKRPAVDLVWYEGGMKPPIPHELDEDRKELDAEGMMFVGDRGKILAGFRVDSPRLIPESRMQGQNVPAPAPRRRREPGQVSPGIRQWIAGCKGGQHSPGSFVNAWPISEAVNMYGVALRSRQKLLYDGDNLLITNSADANKYLSREYRKGWEPQSL